MKISLFEYQLDCGSHVQAVFIDYDQITSI